MQKCMHARTGESKYNREVHSAFVHSCVPGKDPACACSSPRGLFAATLSAQTTTLKVIPPPARRRGAAGGRQEDRVRARATRCCSRGTGKEHPKADDTSTVNYTGWTTDGKMFDSSVARGKPATFPLNRVIAGWTEGVQLMVAARSARFWIPEALAYKGQPGRRRACSSSTSSCIDICRAARRRADVKAPPADAKKTVERPRLQGAQPGTGKEHPKADSKVRCTTRAGRPTARCSTARWCAASPAIVSARTA